MEENKIINITKALDERKKKEKKPLTIQSEKVNIEREEENNGIGFEIVFGTDGNNGD